jgi:hypothetical protein
MDLWGLWKRKSNGEPIAAVVVDFKIIQFQNKWFDKQYIMANNSIFEMNGLAKNKLWQIVQF